MPRLRNPETISKIIDASWRLFKKKGYSATSYADISAESEVNRGTVQHYFPKKEIIASKNLERLRFCAVATASKEFPDSEDSFANFYILGQIYIASLLSCKESRRFFCDVLENRALTDETITIDFIWSMAYVFGRSVLSESDEQLHQDSLVSMGGLYELMFYCIKNNSGFDISERLKPGFRILSRLMGLSTKDCDNVFATYAIDNSRLVSLGKTAYDQTFKVPAEI